MRVRQLERISAPIGCCCCRLCLERGSDDADNGTLSFDSSLCGSDARKASNTGSDELGIGEDDTNRGMPVSPLSPVACFSNGVYKSQSLKNLSDMLGTPKRSCMQRRAPLGPPKSVSFEDLASQHRGSQHGGPQGMGPRRRGPQQGASVWQCDDDPSATAHDDPPTVVGCKPETTAKPKLNFGMSRLFKFRVGLRNGDATSQPSVE